MNVYQKINEVKKVVKAFTKDKETTGVGSYSYASGSQILGIIKEKMEEIGLLLLPIETEHRNYEIFNYKNSYGKDKTDFLVNGKLIYEWINIDEPSDRQKVSFDYYGQQNDLSKAFGSALTYSERYLLLKSFGAPTDEDDPDAKTKELSGGQLKTPIKPTQSPKMGADTYWEYDAPPEKTVGKKEKSELENMIREEQLKEQIHNIKEAISKNGLDKQEVTAVIKPFGIAAVEELTNEIYPSIVVAFKDYVVKKKLG